MQLRRKRIAGERVMPRPQYARQGKYRNVPTVVDGIKFASKAQAKRYAELKLLERAGAISDLRAEVPFRLEVNGVLVCKYVADATYTERINDPQAIGERFVAEDTKSPATRKNPVFRLKAKLMKAIHGIEIRITE